PEGIEGCSTQEPDQTHSTQDQAVRRGPATRGVRQAVFRRRDVTLPTYARTPASWRSALQEQADPGGDQQDADEPDEGALREAGVDVAAQEQSGRYDGKSSRRGHERLPPEQPQDDKGDQPDTAVDEEVEGEGRAERPLLEIPQAQIDDVERASAAEQRPHEAAQQPTRDREDSRAAQRGEWEHLVHREDDHEGAEPVGQRR